MSLKRKCDFDQFDSSSCPEDASTPTTTKYIKTEQLLNRTSPNHIFSNNNSPTNDHNERK